MGALHAMRIGMAWLLAALPASATTWVVDDNGGPGVDFVNIQDAVNAAADGDVIEVRDGAYPGFTIDGKSLVVIADVDPEVGESARVSATVLVRNVGASGRVELDGFEIGAPWSSAIVTAVLIETSQGSVRLIDCEVTGQDAACTGPCSALPSGHAVHVSGSDDVVLVRCTATGGLGITYYTCSDQCYTDDTPARPGLLAQASNVQAFDCAFTGGDGPCAPGDTVGGVPGASGAFLQVSNLFASGSSFVRGEIIHECLGHCHCSFPGSSVRMMGGGSTFTWKDCTFQGTIVGLDSEVAIAPFCLGTYEECPCGNHGADTAGCEHSFGLGGARLEGVGNASVSSDTVTLQVTGLNANGGPTALFFQGTTGNEGTPFNDGLLCTSGTVIRMKGKPASNGTVSFGFGQPGDPLVSSAGNVPPAGATRFYQVWYRNNSASFCTPLRFNMSNGVEIAWAP